MDGTIRGVDHGPRLTFCVRYSFQRRVKLGLIVIGIDGAGGFTEFVDLRFFSHAKTTFPHVYR